MAHPLPRRLIASALLTVMAGAGQATPAADAALAYKLTTGAYTFSDHSTGWDVNLRHSSDWGNLWGGYFRLASQETTQWRAGWDRSYGTAIRMSPSIQFASGGFVGGSVQVETGDPWFIGAGLGRTNLRPYLNLNFDPNDAYLLSAGHRRADNQLFMVQLVRDNRQNPDQRHLHFTWRQPLPEGDRLTLDALYKTGIVENERIRRWGFSATYDGHMGFVRLAWDPKTNFTRLDALRFSVGSRF
ncbi:MAG: hypothetical protein PHI55_02810 [Burkholderiaceae bacterium]|nr:hypothetical protein [Burkholderiaceae bacterium]